ncbi:uncharacterized protein LOC135499842 [Lineus longissimus]|uniref:uncharacterized protein LOC135499842 n=1 Tax=Lineus longissimus TaxID=88925 RepID=UPI00315C88B3
MYTECFGFLDSMKTSVADMHTKHFLTTLLAGFDTGKLKHLCDQIEQYNMCIAKQYHVKDGCYDKCMLEFIRTNLESRGITTAVARYGFSVLLLNAYNRVADSSNPEDLITLDKLTEESIQHFEAHPYDKYTDDMTDKMRTDDSTCVKMHDEKLFWDDLRPIVERGHWYTTKTLEVQLMNVVKKHEVDHLVEVLDTTLFRYWKGKVEKDQKEKCKTPISQNESRKRHYFVPYNTGNHWVLLIVDTHCKKCFVFDSLYERRDERRDDIMYIFHSIHGNEFTFSKCTKKTCHQKDTYSCGLMCVRHAEYFIMRYVSRVCPWIIDVMAQHDNPTHLNNYWLHRKHCLYDSSKIHNQTDDESDHTSDNDCFIVD